MWPVFADWRIVLGSMSCANQGLDVYGAVNPCDLWRRPFAYPSTWLWIGHGLGPWVDYIPVIESALAMIALYFMVLFWYMGRLSWFEGIIWLLCLCSPSVFLALERGNVDLLMMVGFMAFSALLTQPAVVGRCGAWVIGVLLSTLKPYAIVVYALIRRNQSRAERWCQGIGLLVFVGSMMVQPWTAMAQIMIDAQQVYHAFGSAFGFERLLGMDPRQASLWGGISAVSVALGLWGIQAWGVLRGRQAMEKDSFKDYSVTSSFQVGLWQRGFLLGGLIYTLVFSVFAFGNNYAYRLLCLFLCLPWVLQEVRNKNNWRTHLPWLGIMALLWTPFLNNLSLGWAWVHQGISWLVYGWFIWLIGVYMRAVWGWGKRWRML